MIYPNLCVTMAIRVGNSGVKRNIASVKGVITNDFTPVGSANSRGNYVCCRGDYQYHFARAVSTSGVNMVPAKRCITLDNLNPNIKAMEYAVRGPLVIRASEIEKELQKGVDKPFSEVIKANIGDCHAMGQSPITFIRQVLALVTYPVLLKDPRFAADAKSRAKAILKGCRGGSVGAYTDSTGLEIVRRHIAAYIEERDAVVCNYEDILLSAGASEGIKNILKLFITNDTSGNKKCGVMVPVPQYPLYSATLAEFNMHQIGYYLDEENGWGLDMNELKRALDEARKVCQPRAIVIINPGNPTGQVLTKTNIEEIIKFAFHENLFILADEVYQHNVYAEGCSFHSCKKVMYTMEPPFNRLEMASFMSVSKGYMGECGLRGGYTEVVNLDLEVKGMLLKCISAMLCPTVLGQAAMDVVMNPPKLGEQSYDLYQKEKTAVLASLAERAKMVEHAFNSIEGMSCNVVQGAMYAFPRIKLPKKAVEKAKQRNMAPDAFYAFELLENTGICIVPGSGFGQKEGTYHFRTTILPQPDKLEMMLEMLREFHENFLKEYE